MSPGMRKPITILTSIIGLVCIFIGLLIPSGTLIAALRSIPPELHDQLLLGGNFFKFGLLLMGVLLIILPRLEIWQNDPDEKQDQENQQSTWILIILVVLLIISFGLRLYGLNAGLWLDEILTHVKYARLPYGEIITTFDSENQHFLFTLLAHTSYLLFGETAAALRLPAVLFGVGSILALYLLGREVADAREGLLAAALMAFTYHHVWFSQNARGYTGLLFWTIFSSWLFVRGLSRSGLMVWILYAVSAALGVYTHLTMGFILVSHFLIYLFVLISRRKSSLENGWPGFFVGFGLTGIFIYLLHALPFPQILSGMAGTESVVAEWRNPFWTLLELTRGLQINFAGGVMAIGALLLFGAGLISYWKNRPVMVGLLILPPVIGASLVIAAGHHLWPRFFFFAFGFGTLVVVRGTIVLANLFARWLSKVTPLRPQNLDWFGTGACVLMIIVSAMSIPFAYGPKQDYGGALEYIQNNLETGDVVVAAYLADFVYDEFYHTDWESANSLDELNEIRKGANRTWLVYTFEPVLASVNPDIIESVRSEFDCMREYPGTVGSGMVVVCRADGQPGSAAVK